MDLRCAFEDATDVAVVCSGAVGASSSAASPWDFGWLHIGGILTIVAALLTLHQKFKADKASQLWSRIEWSLDRAKSEGSERTIALVYVAGLLEEKKSRWKWLEDRRKAKGIVKFKYDLEPLDVDTLRLAGLEYQKTISGHDLEAELDRLESEAKAKGEPSD